MMRQRRDPKARRMRIAPLALLVGAAGAVLQYFLDPQRGRTRRVQTKDQVLAAIRRPARRAQDRLSKSALYAQDRAKGLAHEVTKSAGEEAPAEDRTLVDKVRSEVLGKPEYSGYTINVNAVDGVVTLRGELDRPELINALRDDVAEVPGVREVESFLHLPGTPPPNV